MTQTMSIEEYNQWRNRGKRHKYHVADPDKRKWRGKTYASKGEMEYAQNLIEQMNAGEIVEIVEQPRIRLGPDSVYVPDFLIMPTSGFPYFADFKGVETPAFRRAKKLWAKYGRLDLVVVKKSGKKFKTVETVNGGSTPW